MKKAFLITLGIGVAVSAGVVGYAYYWAVKNFDTQG